MTHHYTYYPGCSLQAIAHAYDRSAMRVGEVLGLHFDEVEDWNCCGATEYFSINALPAYSLVARNLSLAAQQGSGELVAPCSACYLNLRKTNRHMSKYPVLNERVNRALAAGGLEYQPDSLRIRHLLDVIVEDVGYDAVQEKVQLPLKGLRLAPYYGCLIVRPDSRYNSEYPMHLDELMHVLGATVVDYPMKTHCCGGHMTQISEETAYGMMRALLHAAAEHEADMIVTLCPMCQLNLDSYQPQVNRMFGTDYEIPVLFFTQLMGLAFGLSAEGLGIGSEIISAAQALEKIGTEEPPQPREKKRHDKTSLPMPLPLLERNSRS